MGLLTDNLYAHSVQLAFTLLQTLAPVAQVALPAAQLATVPTFAILVCRAITLQTICVPHAVQAAVLSVTKMYFLCQIF